MGKLSPQVLRCGKDEPLPERIEVHAGPLSMVYGQADLRYVRLGETEVVRRVYVGVRDSSWSSVPPRISNTRIEARADSFLITFDAEHREGPVHFAWKGAIRGSPEGTVEFGMDGRALSTFITSRTGICVLHPIRECAGRPCTVEHTDGTATRGAFPLLISPHQPFMDIRAIRHAVQDGVTAEVRFAGDVFEMEDQRNWTDESYKTYSGPLSRPRPFEVKEGSRISQRVTLVLHGRPIRPRPRASEVTLTLGREVKAPMPAIGLCAAGRAGPLAGKELERLKRLNLSHLRADLRLYEPNSEAALRRAWAEARALGTRLEAAVLVSDDAENELKALRELLEDARPSVARWLVFHKAQASTSARWVEVARAHLGAFDPAAGIGGGTNGNFAEVNRARPPAGAFDVVSFAMNPQVHAFDNASMAEALQGQRWAIRTARRFIGDAALAVSRITLGPRGRPDERQMSLFGAAWTVGSLKQMAESGVQSATYYETTGPLGVMGRADGPPPLGGCVFPVYHVLAELGEFAGLAGAVPLTSSRPLAVDGLAVRKDGVTRLLLANLSPDPQTVTVAGLPQTVHTKRLDETNAEAAMTGPEAYRAQEGERSRPAHGALKLDLLPYGLAFIDAEGRREA